MFFGYDWAWALPLLVLTTVAHVCALVLITAALARIAPSKTAERRQWGFIVAVALIALGTAVLHSLEATGWAILYLWVGAVTGAQDAMLYSLGAITSYGHVGIFLADRWKLLGAFEAVDGLILFGLTTAFLFAAIQQLRPTP
jgi:hypothetical protein